ncbi:MAG: hypothetical protein ABIJ56_09130 [Pseudomonadota bacterium]
MSCREASERAGDEESGVFTIRQLQNFNDPGHPVPETEVKIKNVVVTAVDEFDEDMEGRIGTIWISEVDETGQSVCGKWCGITVYNPAVVPESEHLAVGDLVTVTGVYAEFLYDDDGSPPDPEDPFPYYFSHLSEIYQATVAKTGEWLPVEPAAVEASDILMDPTAEQSRQQAEAYEGVLVTVRNLTVSEDYDNYGQFETGEGVMVEDDLFHYPCHGYAESIAGTRFDSVTGIISWFGIRGLFGNYKILPRGPADISPTPEFSECEF